MSGTGGLSDEQRAILRAVHLAPRRVSNSDAIGRLVELGLVTERHAGLVLTSRGLGELRAAR